MGTDEVLPAGLLLPRQSRPLPAGTGAEGAGVEGGGVEDQVGLPWLLRLRWGAVASQVAVLLVAKFALSVELALLPLAALVAFVGVSNAVLWFGPKPRGAWLTGAVLVTDVLVLTLLLAATGGAANPFTIFFLVHVALGALLMPPRAVWGLVALTTLSFGALFVLAPPQPGHRLVCGDLRGAASLHLVGMWVAYALAASFVGHFLTRIAAAIRLRDHRLAEVAQQNERLAALSSFSANAAHELGTPLATITLAASELRRALEAGRPPHVLLADATLVSTEVDRCRTILSDLSARAGEAMGEMPVRTTPTRLVAQVRRLLAPRREARLSVSGPPTAATLELLAPEKTVAQALHNLLKNAFEAHDEAGAAEPVLLETMPHEGGVLFRVLDRGAGLPPALLTRLGRPFVTTRAAQGGLGLGVYLVHAYAARTGGWLRYAARAGGGTEATLFLRANVLEELDAGR